ncbi:MAG: hypothetical protein LBP63_01485 [Prevotellaceae bacterium]|jgi:hypothetical protein|nr:hypothetical protein [Prevotellaceae bacterium]
MKKLILKTTAILLILAGVVACGKENTDNVDFHEITIGSANPVINYVANGIEFEFCLLNEQGEPATIFNEGKNFSFYFQCTNNDVNKELEIDNGFFPDLLLSGFCYVISQQNGTIGYPCTLRPYTMEYRKYPLYGEDNRYAVTVPWNCEGWGDLNCYPESFPKESLSAGKYYTEFTHKFRFLTKKNPIDIPISVKINFEIK